MAVRPATARPRSPRRDGARNRAHLIAVASAAFHAEGLDVGVDEIARRANVGVATLYRHFPAKRDLVVAVSDALLEQLVALRDGALATGAPAHALARFFRDALVPLAANRGLTEALAQHPPDPAVRDHMRDQALAVLAPLAERGHATGELHPAYDAQDLLVVLRMASAAADPTLTDAPARYLDLLLGGLRRAP